MGQEKRTEAETARRGFKNLVIVKRGWKTLSGSPKNSREFLKNRLSFFFGDFIREKGKPITD